MEAGVAYNVEYAKNQREFLEGKAFGLQTDGSKKASPPQQVDEDNHPDSHGTMVASVALGQRFGVAKKATLISAKSTRKIIDRLEAIDMVYADLTVSIPNRPYNPDVKKTVVVMSFNFGVEPKVVAEAKRTIMRILKLGVPVVVSSGNGRKTVDQVNKSPAVSYGPDFPVIIVGGTNIDGNRDVFSQGGPNVAVHAPGSEVDVSNKDGTKATKQGTSFAAPAVGGLIATYMAYNTIPWDETKTKKDRVTEIRNYLQSDKSSVVRGSESDIRTIWNGVSKSDYDNVVVSAILPSKGWSLSIALVSSVSPHLGGADTDHVWRFYTTKVGKAVGSCGETEGQAIGAESNDKPINPDIYNPPWVGGTYKLNIEGEACEYKCDGTNPGRLYCPKKEITCKEDSLKAKKEGSLKCGNAQFFHPVVYCDF